MPDRQPGAPGIDPCPQLEERGGIWQFNADVAGQKFTKEARFATGMRQPVALALARRTSVCRDEQPRFAGHVVSGEGFTAEDNANRPREPLLLVEQGDVFGWPYCYLRRAPNKMILAPEYGGDGKTVGRCSQFEASLPGFRRITRRSI